MDPGRARRREQDQAKEPRVEQEPYIFNSPSLVLANANVQGVQAVLGLFCQGPNMKLVSPTITHDTHRSRSSHHNDGDWHAESWTSAKAPMTSSQFHAEDKSFAAIMEDPRDRIIYDLLSVRQYSLVREFYMYVIKDAIMCFIEEKKKSIGQFLQPAPLAEDGAGTHLQW
ncbi:hypothetical protein GLOTRDRAFT_130647 [Gloeophyllum trabeum ATCC 11539]|uniref:Uncharacterized protein n=1 Tax=Gloeophyllum trabeum (strain ATCC 11539 / FP-39264 / Madison 617) TaxID=670483 RepID=S7RIU3_GLOTA|nr:uncharacterized protein GLOTRDRAFT_130647 [Gloeophyllum trabeum ATCC 11539]EPQ54275.1 hypothetical protein GLOTRDRAFT_130647 [Gloeophyllum trabeum ATCC 11539]